MSTVDRLDGPPAQVSTIYAIGRNYAKHVAELGNTTPADPVVFLKARTTVRGVTQAPVAFPTESFHHECELVLLLGSEVPLGADPGWGAVEAVTVGLDVTRRQVQTACKERRVPWTPGKSFQGSAVVAPLIPLDHVGDPDLLTFGLDVNGTARQRGAVRDMTFGVPELLRYLASLTPLVPGDLVFTGTPEGVGPLVVGDRFELTLTGTERAWTFPGQL